MGIEFNVIRDTKGKSDKVKLRGFINLDKKIELNEDAKLNGMPKVDK